MTTPPEQCRVPIASAGQRFDVIAAEMFPRYSRARLQEWIKSGALTLSGRQVKPNVKLCGGELLELQVEARDQGEWQAEPLALDVVYEDQAILVLNKPAGLVVHPAAGNWEGTLLNGLLHRLPQSRTLPRAGIVHRLDKDTTGLMVVAKTLEAQNHLVRQLQARSVKRQYMAVVLGTCPAKGVVEGAIGRDPVNRKRMAVVPAGKPARTHFTRVAELGSCSLVRLQLETGRTHQIRVHMNHLGHPLVGDPLYGQRLRRKSLSESEYHTLAAFGRQALHAYALALDHPDSGQLCHWRAHLPGDMTQLIRELNNGESIDVQ